MQLFAPSIAFVDLETTGTTASHDRIIEVGVVKVEEGKVSKWQTIVNPESPIPVTIQRFTGITDSMVVLSPTFAEIRRELLEQLNGSVFVAHNARFDYGFLKNEFRRLDINFKAKVLCTVKLSRKFYPKESHHNLDTVIARHGLTCDARHRALGDAKVLWDFLLSLYETWGEAAVNNAVQELLKTPSLPSHLPQDVLQEIPEAPGVYLFYGVNEVPLYVGKSLNLRSRVLSHFSGDHRTNKDLKLSQEVRRIEWIETAGELGALLREAKLIKELMPIFNRRLRREREWFTFQIQESGIDQKTAPVLILVGTQDVRFDSEVLLYGLFQTKRKALKALREIARSNQLCSIRLGLEKGKGPCFAYQVKRCKGVCVGKESPVSHDLRLATALAALRIKSWPFHGRIGIRENDECRGRTEIHVLDAWRHLGTVYAETDLYNLSDSNLSREFNADNYRILVRYLRSRQNRLDLINFV
ncbi:MAG TPA: exonuclease domain-containing protein [Burkholderiales bacterium]